MYLVETSVLIDFLKGKETTQTTRLEYIMQHKIPFAISAFTYQETVHKNLGKPRNVIASQNLQRDFSTIV